MDINWYPGHMAKSIRMIEETVRLCDVLVYVLDARAPKSCLNPDFAPLLDKKPAVYALNKSDLADEAETARWKSALVSKNSLATCLNATVSKSTAELLSAVKRLASEKITRYESKGVRATLRVMVLGVPNTGKSTIINNLIGKSKAITGNKAGVTRGKQWFSAGDRVEFLDTPGTLYPRLGDKVAAAHLAYLGSIKDEVVDACELAAGLLAELEQIAPGAALARYGAGSTLPVTLGTVAKSRGLLLRGGEEDTERAARAVLDDFRKGRLGRITLEKAEEL